MTFLELLQRGHPSCAATSDYSQSHATTAMLQDWYGIVSVCGAGRDTLGPPTSIIRLGENIKSRSTNTNWILGPSRLGSATRQQEHPQVSVHRCGSETVTCYSPCIDLVDVWFRDRDVLFFVDNMTTLKICVNGYDRHPDIAHLSNDIHLALVGLSRRVYFKWVPGKANPVALPSRDDFIVDPVTSLFVLDTYDSTDKDRDMEEGV